MDPNRAVRSDAALGTSCTGNGAEGTDGGGGGENSIKPDNIKITQIGMNTFQLLVASSHLCLFASRNVINIYSCIHHTDKNIKLNTT